MKYESIFYDTYQTGSFFFLNETMAIKGQRRILSRIPIHGMGGFD